MGLLIAMAVVVPPKRPIETTSGKMSRWGNREKYLNPPPLDAANQLACLPTSQSSSGSRHDDLCLVAAHDVHLFLDSTIEIGPTTTSLGVSGWDSLSLALPMLEIESGFGAHLDLEKVADCANVGDLAAASSPSPHRPETPQVCAGVARPPAIAASTP